MVFLKLWPLIRKQTGMTVHISPFIIAIYFFKWLSGSLFFSLEKLSLRNKVIRLKRGKLSVLLSPNKQDHQDWRSSGNCWWIDSVSRFLILISKSYQIIFFKLPTFLISDKKKNNFPYLLPTFKWNYKFIFEWRMNFSPFKWSYRFGMLIFI